MILFSTLGVLVGIIKLVCKCNISVHLTLSVIKSVPVDHGPFLSLFSLSGFHFIEGRAGGDINRLRKCLEHQRTVNKDFTVLMHRLLKMEVK